MMRQLIGTLVLVAALMALPAAAETLLSADPLRMPAGTWALDRTQSSVTTRVRHLGLSWYVARFNVFDATLTGSPSQISAIRLTASVDATSMDVGTDHSRRFAEQFLDASRASRVTFVSSQVQQTSPTTATVTGALTLRGITKPAVFNVTFNGVGPGLMGDTRAGFTAVGVIKRSDFGSEFLLNVVGDDVTVTIEAEFVKR